METLRRQLFDFITEHFLYGLDGSLSDDDSLLENEIIDSTGVLELVMYLEETFGFVVEDEELIPDNLDSINQLVTFIMRKKPNPQQIWSTG